MPSILKKKINIPINPVPCIVASKGKRSKGMVGLSIVTSWSALPWWGLCPEVPAVEKVEAQGMYGRGREEIRP